jgi:ribonucleoside-triphosphate reductase
LIDGDGYIDKYGDMEYSSVSKDLANDILEVFSKMGILCGISEKKPKRNNETILYRLRISKHEMFRIKDQLGVIRNVNRIVDKENNKPKRFLPVVRVKKTSKLNVEDNKFYDLTTKKNHNYLCGKNTLVFIHNTVLHGFLGESIDNPEVCKQLVKKIATNFRLPYFTITPTFSVCPVHGYIKGEHYDCPFNKD